ncbi:hypothetical protein EVAR_41870_1 [Eumeta japonica]|uniref:Uncharacterized protein n=1 Tax=Eumeta variegata TaxID=151549 RepID=A0A4C1XCT7_EUMVA|nr:hypothetical protein EVAR_41870_1 [Eumeta japonica]
MSTGLGAELPATLGTDLAQQQRRLSWLVRDLSCVLSRRRSHERSSEPGETLQQVPLYLSDLLRIARQCGLPLVDSVRVRKHFPHSLERGQLLRPFDIASLSTLYDISKLIFKELFEGEVKAAV